ncbi:MAG: nickel pincer cofactor biosynthesis protein LarB [Euryarchaeota archaeon]|nr:nickel pincer cofactor biosynthesis protein LarB [Euryarchaeota archaeon]
MRVGDYACIDLDREARTGVPEVVLAEGKTLPQLVGIARAMVGKKGRAIVTRASPEALDALSRLPFSKRKHPDAGMMVLWAPGFKAGRTGGTVGVLSAGTSDYRVAEEARLIAEELGCRVVVAHDVGVAGVHRLVEALGRMRRSKVDVYVACAGREGALPTLLAGMVDVPVIGVPVSTGYGIAGRGRSALYAMLQSCSPLVVVNIDAGFVAGAVAARIAHGRRGR